MAFPLVKLLGLKAMVRVLRALGALRDDARHPAVMADGRDGLKRSQFLRVAAGAMVVGGMVVAGKPAFAEQRKNTVTAWVAANRDKLPKTYDGITAYSEPYRRVIYSAQTPAIRSSLWVERVARYRAAQSGLTADQNRVLDRVAAMAGDLRVFDRNRPDSVYRQFDLVREQVDAAFGADKSRSLIATLGTADAAQPMSPLYDCTCSGRSDWCVARSMSSTATVSVSR
jgi:hypothetical protein